MKITRRYKISIDLNKYLMRKKLNPCAISSRLAVPVKKLNVFITFHLNYKILNQNAIFLYNRHIINLQID